MENGIKTNIVLQNTWDLCNVLANGDPNAPLRQSFTVAALIAMSWATAALVIRDLWEDVNEENVAEIMSNTFRSVKNTLRARREVGLWDGEVSCEAIPSFWDNGMHAVTEQDFKVAQHVFPFLFEDNAAIMPE